MINDELVYQAAIDHGMRIGDEQLATSIRSLDVFKEDGKFSQARYESWLRQQGYVPGSFEYSFRRSLLSAQLHAGIADSAIVTAGDLDQSLKLQEQQRGFAYLQVPVSRFQDVAEVTDEAVTAYYERHRDQFVNPEKVNISYLELSRSGIAAGISISDEELESRYDAQKANYMTEEQRRASHILISLSEDASAEDEERARERAQQLKARIDAGESFEELARAHSEDPGSAQTNGDLGIFGKGWMRLK